MAPEEPSYRELLQLVEKIKKVSLKGVEGIRRVVIRKEGDEYVLYTEGSSLRKVMQFDGVDPTRTKTNNINEIGEVLGIEAARNAIINEATDTLREQGLAVDVRHIMLVADIMTVDGEVKQIGRHGVSGEKASVLARAAFEVTVNHILDAAVRGDVDDLQGVTENVIVGQPIQLGTGGVQLVARR
jgi:DNA-directed RNA polymerase subunit A"